MADVDPLRADARARVSLLSSSELQILYRIVEGASSRDIAQFLGIGPREVEYQRERLLEKLGAKTTADAVRVGIYAGLTKQKEASDGWPTARSPETG